MLFNSLDFAIFLPTTFIVYWALKKSRHNQNIFINVASYCFYGWWDWRFLGLILLSTVVDYWVGQWLYNSKTTVAKKRLLGLSVSVNLGLLFFYKYCNFFLENFANSFTVLGMEIETSSIDILLPVGISFYTFQTLSYTIDIYRGKLTPVRDYVSFSAFVSFFPQLVAGPIEKATNLLPQFQNQRTFDYSKAVDGLRQILWGLFKKMVIADNCATIVNSIFENPSGHSGSMLTIASVLFVFQVYGDFSGYSDIAIGTGRLFGFNLVQNFAFPLFSRDMPELWRRWHISLSKWFIDYVYIPLGGSRCGKLRGAINILLLFGIIGFWHGSNWTFVIWGLVNGMYILPKFLMKAHKRYSGTIASGKQLPSLLDLMLMVKTCFLFSMACVIIRSPNISEAWNYFGYMVSGSFLDFQKVTPQGLHYTIYIIFFIVVEWNGRASQHALQHFGLNWSRHFRLAFYFMIGLTILVFAGDKQQFYYFQF